MATTFARFPSPVGELVLTASDTALKGVRFPLPRNRVTPEEEPEWVEDAGRGPAAGVLHPLRLLFGCHAVAGQWKAHSL